MGTTASGRLESKIFQLLIMSKLLTGIIPFTNSHFLWVSVNSVSARCRPDPRTVIFRVFLNPLYRNTLFSRLTYIVPWMIHRPYDCCIGWSFLLLVLESPLSGSSSSHQVPFIRSSDLPSPLVSGRRSLSSNLNCLIRSWSSSISSLPSRCSYECNLDREAGLTVVSKFHPMSDWNSELSEWLIHKRVLSSSLPGLT